MWWRPFQSESPPEITVRKTIGLQGGENMTTRMLIRSLLVALLITIILGIGGGTLAEAAVCSVPSPYPTIQAAVNDGSCTTIDVAPGMYVENVTINRSLI